MKRPLAYITAPWSKNPHENAASAANYCRQVYDAGYSPVCPVLFLPLFLKDEIPQEHKDGATNGQNGIATAERLRITATTLDGILTVKGQGREKGGAHHA